MLFLGVACTILTLTGFFFACCLLFAFFQVVEDPLGNKTQVLVAREVVGVGTKPTLVDLLEQVAALLETTAKLEPKRQLTPNA